MWIREQIGKEVLNELINCLRIYSKEKVDMNLFMSTSRTRDYFRNIFTSKEEQMNFRNLLLQMHFYCEEGYGVSVPLPKRRLEEYQVFPFVTDIWQHFYQSVVEELDLTDEDIEEYDDEFN